VSLTNLLLSIETSFVGWLGSRRAVDYGPTVPYLQMRIERMTSCLQTRGLDHVFLSLSPHAIQLAVIVIR